MLAAFVELPFIVHIALRALGSIDRICGRGGRPIVFQGEVAYCKAVSVRAASYRTFDDYRITKQRHVEDEDRLVSLQRSTYL